MLRRCCGFLRRGRTCPAEKTEDRQSWNIRCVRCRCVRSSVASVTGYICSASRVLGCIVCCFSRADSFDFKRRVHSVVVGPDLPLRVARDFGYEPLHFHTVSTSRSRLDENGGS